MENSEPDRACRSECRSVAGGIIRCCRVEGHILPHRADDGREWVRWSDTPKVSDEAPA